MKSSNKTSVPAFIRELAFRTGVHIWRKVYSRNFIFECIRIFCIKNLECDVGIDSVVDHPLHEVIQLNPCVWNNDVSRCLTNIYYEIHDVRSQVKSRFKLEDWFLDRFDSELNDCEMSKYE